MLRRNKFNEAARGEVDAMMMIAVQWRAGRNQFQVNLRRRHLGRTGVESNGERGVWAAGRSELCIYGKGAHRGVHYGV